MENKILKKLVIVMIIVTLIAADFLMLGKSITSYASSIDISTNNENIDFSVYFKNAEGDRIDSVEENINRGDLKLYAEVAVKNEGYFNGTIEIQESNFNIKNEILSNAISKIEGNKIMLNQINAGSKVEMELAIDPIKADEIEVEQLTKNAKVKLTGTYMETSYKGKDIEAEKTVNLNLKLDKENTSAEVSSEIVTNKVYAVNGTNKRVVQMLVKSKITNNNYPVKQTVLTVAIPETQKDNLESVKISAIRTKATNGEESNVVAQEWKSNSKEAKNDVQIKIDNKGEKIVWKKGVEDEFIITYIYKEETAVNGIELKANTEIEVYNEETKLSKETTAKIGTEDLSNIIVSETNIDKTETYKGQLYANAKTENKKEITFKSTTKMIVRATQIADTVSIRQEKDVFTTTGEELDANTKYIKTYINKEKMTKVLGQEGYIEIKNAVVNNKITKDSETDENGNVVIEYSADTREIEITTSKPVNEGILEINHEKAITRNEYTSEQIKTITGLKSRNTLTAQIGETKIVENNSEDSKELKETYSKAELTVNKANLATMLTNNEVVLGVKFVTDSFKYDLYKNPTIKIQLPTSVTKINVSSINKLYGDEFEVSKAEYNNVDKTINIALNGEQMQYAENDVKQLYLQITADIKLDQTAGSKAEKITMSFTNENAVQYEGNGTIEKEIGIVAPNAIVVKNDISTYNVNSIAGTSQDKQIVKLSQDKAGTQVEFKTEIINNTGSNLNNVKILGNFPTDGEFARGNEKIKNTLTTNANPINAQNATIYYSNNINASTDINDAKNGWTQNISEVTNPKVYLIEVGEMNVEEAFSTTYKVQLPSSLGNNLLSYAGYKVIYEGDTIGNQEVESALVGASTEGEKAVRTEDIKMEVNVTATVGNDKVKTGDTVKAGEVIRYKVTAKNAGERTLNDVTIKGQVPEGAVLVTRQEDYITSGLSYYVENTTIKEVTKTIESLGAEEEASIEYEVRVNMDVTNGTEIINKATATCGESKIESNDFKNKISESKIRVTLKKLIEDDLYLFSGWSGDYIVFVENLSGEEVKDLNLKILTAGQEIDAINNVDGQSQPVEGDNLKISKISANQTIGFRFQTTVKESVKEIMATAVVTDDDGSIYRSNIDKQEIYTRGAKITLTTPNNGEYVKTGDRIVYNFVIENTSNVATPVTITDTISEYLRVEEIKIREQVKLQILDVEAENHVNRISNKVVQTIVLEPNEIVNMSISTKVKPIEEEFETKTIKNKATLKVSEEIQLTSSEVTHIIKGSKSSGTKNIISGTAWLDKNQNGQKDIDDEVLSDIIVRVLDIETNQIAKDKEGKVLETKTNADGIYTFSKVENGNYIIIFEYDTSKYEPTKYMQEGVSEDQNSNVVEREVIINGTVLGNAATDIIEILTDKFNVNIGLKQDLKYDLELGKYISKIIVQNQKGTRTYDYTDEEATFKKVEIHAKQVENSVVVLEYTIKVKNTGEIAGYVTNIRDYLPSGLTFNSELNPEWYLSGEDLYTKSFANTKIEPGETKEIKLILTKTMTKNNVGLINNRAEIVETYNEYGKLDIDSIVDNQANEEDDLGSVDTIIDISTGMKIITNTMLIMLNTALIAAAIYLIFIKNKRAK